MNNRILTMMRLLDSRKKFTARELADRFNVSIRTIQRDLDHLQKMGFPLYAEVGANGGYRVLPNRILPPLQLTKHEAFGMFMMIEYLENVSDFPYGSIRTQLADQHFTSLPQEVQDEIVRMRQHIAFVQHHGMHPEPLTTFILSAAVEKREVEFSYASRSGTKKVQAYPLGVYYEHGYWYMPAQKGDSVLLYRVDRMGQLEILQHSEKSVPTLNDWLHSKDSRQSVEVIIQFTEFGARLAQSDTLFKSIMNNRYCGQIPLEEFPFVARKLLAYGPDAKVISPPQLRDIVMEQLESSLRQYE
ncbi:MAG: YafY family transcriptional regulator [Candidatus Pristimantibacillus lignocellulolyticus]|uniref:YafY family transcriptional regulator n=1 Tax=Candidatus Pristimantibacillus lignocellulolyticus TaxID=2994561 RepID=A0A9J6ZIX3_9BACL|nr:MAG: YafY family transcriptional regulator [Candidatus Pristimantibacillus lignocellulolyticus]